MADKRRKDVSWAVADDRGQTLRWNEVQVAVLMDIRDEMKLMRNEVQRLNALLHCQNFTEIPDILRAVKRNTTRKRKPRATGKPALRAVSR